MKDYERQVEEVIGTDPTLLKYWDKMDDRIKRRLLTGDIVVTTLGELQLQNHQLQVQLEKTPRMF